jgi:hypothetical protein
MKGRRFQGKGCKASGTGEKSQVSDYQKKRKKFINTC